MRRITTSAALAALLVAGSGGIAMADPVGEATVDTTGTGLIIDPQFVLTPSSVQVCADARLVGGSGPLLTTITLTTAATTDNGTLARVTEPPVSDVQPFARTASVCSAAYDRTLIYGITFEVTGTGALTLGGAFTGTCTGTLVIEGRGGNGAWLNPCRNEVFVG